MKNIRALIICFQIICLCLTPVFGSPKKTIVSDQNVKSAAFRCYSQFSDSAILSHNVAQMDLIKGVGKDISKAVENYFHTKGMSSLVDSLNWEFRLVKDSRANAFCLPGGKVIVFEGILPLAKNYNGVAIILSHEMAHLMVKHYSARLTRQLKRTGVSDLKNQDLAVFRAMQTIYGIDSLHSMMSPYTIDEEAEADRLALIFMAMAGYDPTDGIKFWKKMDSLLDKHSLDYLRIHSLNKKRIKHLDDLFREVIDYYKYD